MASATTHITYGGNRSSLAILRTILTLADRLDMAVIVEGIEEPTQLRQLQDLGGRLVAAGQ